MRFGFCLHQKSIGVLIWWKKAIIKSGYYWLKFFLKRRDPPTPPGLNVLQCQCDAFNSWLASSTWINHVSWPWLASMPPLIMCLLIYFRLQSMHLMIGLQTKFNLISCCQTKCSCIAFKHRPKPWNDELQLFTFS